MVLICGVSVEKKKLPYVGAIEYVIKPRDVDVKMLAKTRMLQQATEIYATIDAVDYIDSAYRSKTFLIRDATELIEKLYGQPQSDYMAQVASEQKSTIKNKKATKKATETKVDEPVLQYNDGTPVETVDVVNDVFTMSDTDFEQLLAEKETEIQQKDTVILSLNELIQTKDMLYAELQEEMQTYRASELENRIVELQQQIADKDALIATYDMNNADTATMTQQLQEALADCEMCATSLAEKEVLIAELQEKVSMQERQLAQAMTDCDANGTEATALQETIISLRTALTSLETQLDSKEKDIAKYVAQIAEMQNTVARTQEYEYEVKTLQEELSKKEKEITAINAKILHERTQFEQDKETYAQMMEDYENNQKASKIADMLSAYIKPVGKDLEIPKFTSAEMKRLKAINLDNISLLCFARGSSQYAGLCGIQSMMSSGDDFVLVDLTGDAWLPSILHLNRMQTLNNVTKNDINSIVIKKGTVDLIRTRAFNDVQLLEYDWVGILEQLKTYVGDRRTYILLGNISTFSVKYTVMKLAFVLATTLMIKAEPYVVQNLFWDLLGIPSQHITLGVFEYVPVVKQMLDKFVKEYPIKVTKGTDVKEVIAQRNE